MDARHLRFALTVSVLWTMGAVHRSPNFVVEAPTAEIARQVADAAEVYRDELAQEWLGQTMPRWHQPCRVRVKVGPYGAGGATTFAFDRGHVFGWRMTIQGPLDRILDSVLPHEVSHTVFACYFRRPLPRWADEGAATLAEDEQEQRRQRLFLKEVLRDRRDIPLRSLLAIKEYPRDMQDVLTLYAEGFSLADYLVQVGGKTRYLQFLNCAHRDGWDRAVHRYYALRNVEELDKEWNSWIVAGSPRLNLPPGTKLASNDQRDHAASNGPPPVIRSQTPDEAKTAATPNSPRLSAASPVEREHGGRTRAAEDGWIAVTLTRGAKPLPASDPETASGVQAGDADTTFSSNQTPFQPVEPPAAVEDSGSQRDRGSNWTGFPQRRSQGGPGGHGQPSAPSFSP